MSFVVCAQRILHDKIKLLFIIFLLVIPLLDMIQILYDLHQAPETSMPDPRYVAFSALYTVGTNHMLYKVMFWFLPIYLLIITGEDTLEDYDIGYNNILQSRMSRKQYIWGKARNSFCVSFLVIFLSLLLNYGLLQLIFHGGEYNWIEPKLYPAEENRMYTIGYHHPIIVNLINIMMTAILSGLISLIGTGLSLNFHDRKIVYGITFALWFIFVLNDDGLMSILHPFTNMTLDRFIIGFLLIAVGYLTIAMTALIAEVRSDEV